jgi:hypothetical protein
MDGPLQNLKDSENKLQISDYTSVLSAATVSKLHQPSLFILPEDLCSGAPVSLDISNTSTPPVVVPCQLPGLTRFSRLHCVTYMPLLQLPLKSCKDLRSTLLAYLKGAFQA